MVSKEKNPLLLTDASKARILVILLLVLLIATVRLYYYSGPIFANSQDEGIYLNIYAQTLIFNNPITFSQYKNVNFSNFSQCGCNPADEFQFYVGFIYPEMLLLKVFGFSVDLAIFYVILTSIIEGFFIFLIIEKISGIRAAALGAIVFTFLPTDVLFSTHVQPLVPAMMFITISFYAFIIAEGQRKTLQYLYAGAFSGLAYITNPIGIAALLFLLLASIIRATDRKLKFKELKNGAKRAAIIALGFAVVYSAVGIPYLLESGNFFLYPDLTHAVYAYQDATQPIATHCIFSNICLNYITGYPSFYPSILVDQQTTTDGYLRYFGITAYILAAMVVLNLFRKNRNKWSTLFIALFLFYLLVIMFFPTKISFSGGQINYYPIGEQAYITTLLTLPLVVIIALGVDSLFQNKKSYLRYFAITIMLALIFYNVLDLNNDVGYYRASMYTAHAFVNYVTQHPDSHYYAAFLFSGEANLLSAYRYNISSLPNCTARYLSSLPNGTYIATGGTTSLDISPQYTQEFDDCVLPNITSYKLIYTVHNPLANYPQMQAPQFSLYER